MKDDSSLLEVKDLKMYFPIVQGLFARVGGYVRAVDGISFSIRKGETLGLVGESGCGKTTVGRCIVRAYKPTAGEILYRGADGSVVDLVGLGLYPIVGNRPWCRFCCPLAAALGAISQQGRFAIYSDSQRCIECGTCNRYCEMGIDIRLRARQGAPLKDDQCVGCGACIAVCPRYARSFIPFPTSDSAMMARSTRRFRRPFVRQLATPRQRGG